MRFFFLLLLSTLSISVQALEIPPAPEQYVTDRAGVMSVSVVQSLNQFLYQYEQQTSHQIVVSVFPSLENEAIEDFSVRLAQAWKVGQKGRDNGVVFLVFIKDRAARIEVGYGLEGSLPDASARTILAREVFPYFKEGKWDEGVTAGVKAIAKVIAAEGTPGAAPVSSRHRQRQDPTPFLIGFLVICAVLLIVDLIRFGRYAATSSGRSDRYAFLEWFFRFAFLLAVLQLLFRLLFYAMMASGSGGGRRGGGFSGGGGSFGGGGASGRW